MRIGRNFMTSNTKTIVKILATFTAIFLFLNFIMIKLNLREAVFSSFLFNTDFRVVKNFEI